MKQLKRYIILWVLIIICVSACGSSPENSSSISANDRDKQVTERDESALGEYSSLYKKEPSEIYSLATEKIKEGSTLEGIRLLAEIPDYKDAETLLIGYTCLEYYLGEWIADLENDFEKGTTVFPYEMKFTVSDKNIWLDSEINGYYRLRFPVNVESIIWKKTKTESGNDGYQGYLLFKIQNGRGIPEEGILFGLEQGGLWYNLNRDSDNRAKCSFSVSDSDGNVDTKAKNRFYCDRITERQETNITWVKPIISAAVINKDNETDTKSANKDNNQALKKALSYLEIEAFSKDGLIKQLEYEGFPSSVAENAVDNCGADWKEQAILKALSYLEYSAFSYSGLIEQLEYEGFSSSEAQHGADNCGANWNEQAEKKAKQYLDYSSFSRQELVEQLVFEGFTQSQAEYGVSRVY